MRASLLILVMLGIGGWSSATLGDDGSDDFPPPLTHDPSLATSIYIPPLVTTAGVANTGPDLGAMGRAGTPVLPCSRKNPCAWVTPAAGAMIPAR